MYSPPQGMYFVIIIVKLILCDFMFIFAFILFLINNELNRINYVIFSNIFFIIGMKQNIKIIPVIHFHYVNVEMLYKIQIFYRIFCFYLKFNFNDELSFMKITEPMNKKGSWI